MTSTARRSLIGVFLVALAALAVDELGDMFQSRPDRVAPGSRSEVVLLVEEQGYVGSVDAGAENLLAACSGTVSNRVVEDPGMVELGDGRYQFTVTPSLGRHNRVKLVGCLEDFTVDNLRGDVLSVETPRN